DVLGAMIVACLCVFPAAVVVLIRGGLAARKSTIPFGPFLALGALIVLFAPHMGGSLMPAARDCRPAAAARAQLDSSRFDVARFEVVYTGRLAALLGPSLRAPVELTARVQPPLII